MPKQRHAWDAAKTILLPLPFLFLVAYAVRLPLPLPSAVLPERTYLALDRGIDAESYARLRGRGEAFAVLADSLLPLPSAGADSADRLAESRARLPEHAVIAPLLDDLRSGIGPFERARLVIDRLPTRDELAALAAAGKQGGVPLRIERIPGHDGGIVQALSLEYAPTEQRVAFDLLLSPAARAEALVELFTVPSPGRSGTLLFRSTGAALPPDLVLRLSVPRSEAGSLELSSTDRAGKTARLDLSLGVEVHERPRVLVLSNRPASARTVIEELYPSSRATPAEADSLDLHAFELIVIDGIPLASITGGLRDQLVDVARRRTGSLLFAADSPDFGKEGDNPPLERLLPVTLMPRSLKDLPDLAALILIDDSGSMFGDKLSLAKVTGLELLRNLKPGDLVGMMLFSDTRSWVYTFQPNSSIVAAPKIEPITAGGGTDLAPALVEGLARLAAQPIHDKHVVLITDGVTKPADFQAIADRARLAGISISALAVGADANRSLLERLALRTGGRYYPVLSADEIPALLFEDRTSEARPTFMQGKIQVLALNGDRVTEIGGMAQYAPGPTASVIFTNALGDPLFASQELGNRAVLLFASDLHGAYTAPFFNARASAGVFKDRLDALFADKPARIRVVETSSGIEVVARSDSLLDAHIVLSRPGGPTVDEPFRRSSPETWTARLVPPFRGTWNASITDRGGSFASFPVVFNGRLSGTVSDDEAAFSVYHAQAFRLVSIGSPWLLLFFAASLASTIVLRFKR
ncbi:MAG TPA: VWA domain-containing protein [Rectinemataceae bacterium]|nr:VWA domain-containing protein [Rectinemataceae bacterium]